MHLEEGRAAVVVAHAERHMDSGVLQHLDALAGRHVVFLASVKPGKIAEEYGVSRQGIHLKYLGDYAHELAALVHVLPLHAVHMDVA